MKNEYYTVSELAKIVGVSRVAIHKRIKKGQLKAIRIGRGYFIPKESVQGYIGNVITEKSKRQIEEAVKKTVKEYGEVLKRLGNE